MSFVLYNTALHKDCYVNQLNWVCEVVKPELLVMSLKYITVMWHIHRRLLPICLTFQGLSVQAPMLARCTSNWFLCLERGYIALQHSFHRDVTLGFYQEEILYIHISWIVASSYRSHMTWPPVYCTQELKSNTELPNNKKQNRPFNQASMQTTNQLNLIRHFNPFCLN